MQAPPAPKHRALRQTLAWALHPERYLRQCAKELGPVFTLTLPVGPVTMITQPELIKEIFTGDPEIFRAGAGNAPLAPAVGKNSILLLDGPRHLRQRRLMLPPFHGKHLENQLAEMQLIAAEQINQWPKQQGFAVEPRLRTITLEVMLRIVFGVKDSEDLQTLRSEFAHLIPTVTGVLTLIPFFRRDLGPLSPWNRYQAKLARINAILYREIAERRADNQLDQRTDILSLLVATRDEDGSALSDDELRDELMTLLLAGHETSAAALAWVCQFIAHAPELQRDLQQEIAEVDHRSPLLQATIEETLRLKPVLPIVVRELAVDYQLGEWKIPAGTRVAPCITLAHRNSSAYQHPDSFYPQRFLNQKPDTYQWIPFGGGIRRCVGAAFAQQEMRVVITEILKRGDINPTNTHVERARRRAIVLAPLTGGKIQVNPRK